MHSATETAAVARAGRGAARGYVWHLTALALVLAAAEMPRFVGSAAPGYLDFDQAYYPAAQSIRSDPTHIYRGATYDGETGSVTITAPAYFVNLPLLAWLFVPFTALPLPQAGTALLGMNAVIALACLLLLQRRAAECAPLWRWGITLAFISSGPLLNALNLGQTTPFVLLVLLLSEAALWRGQEARAGCWLGLACLIKMPPLALLPYFAWRRRWRVAAAALAVLSIVAAISVACYGWALHATYFDVVIRAHAGKALPAHNSQSLESVIARLTTTASIWSWQPMVLPAGARFVRWAMLVSLLAVTGWTLRTRRAACVHARTLLELGAVLCLALVAFPLAWVHYGTWLLPVIVAVGATLPTLPASEARRMGLLLVLGALLINLPMPPPSIIRQFDTDLWFRIAISHQFVGTLLLLGLCLRCLRRYGVGPGQP